MKTQLCLLTALFACCVMASETIVIEGEAGVGGVVQQEARAKGGKVAAKLGKGVDLVWKNVSVEKAGRYKLALETFDTQQRGVEVVVNGGKPEMKTIYPGYDNTAGTETWDVWLKAGANEICVRNEKEPLPAVDRLTLTKVLVVTDAPGRAIVSLDEGWDFRWGKTGEWTKVDLPHDAQFMQPWTQKGTSGARGFKPMGECFYKRTFAYDPAWQGKRVYLDFGGILAVGDVSLNGKLIHQTDYGYLGFEVDITDRLRTQGENLIEVRASTGALRGSRWYTGAGLYRDVKLVIRPQVAITRHGLYVKPTPEKIDASVELEGFRGQGNTAKLNVNVTIRDAAGKAVASATARAPWSKLRHQEVPLSLPLKDAHLWDVDDPYLYTCEATLVYDGVEIDRVATTFGVRTIELDYAYGLKLNGRKLFLKSMSNHHDMGLVGVAAYRRAIERQFQLMKAFGYNAIRCSHNPYSEDFYDLADRYGLLVMDELIDKWSDKDYWFGRRPFTQLWPSLVTEWMKRDRNHPSIFAWSFGNEFQMREDLCGYPDMGDWGVTMYRVLQAFSKRWDDSRPTTAAMFPARAGARGKNDPGFWTAENQIAPEVAQVADFASLNYQYPAYSNYVAHTPGLNIFQSEASVNDLLGPYVGMDQAHSIGCSYWGAIEYWGESKKWPQKGWNYSFFSHTLEPYPTAYLIKSAMVDEPLVRLAVSQGRDESLMWNDVKVGARNEASDWTFPKEDVGKPKRVCVYTNLKTVELFLNGRSLGQKENDRQELQKCNIVTFEVSYEPGTLKAVGHSADGKTVEHVVETAGAAVALKVTVENEAKADGHDLIYLRAEAVDAAGRRVRAATNKVAFACTGAARFLACDNGDHSTNEGFTPADNVKCLNNGFILAAFRAGKMPSIATVTITPEGLPAQTVELKVTEVANFKRSETPKKKVLGGYLRLDETFAPTNSPLSGKTMAVLGDSYVQNHHRSLRETWHCRFAAKHGMRYLNYGRNGNCMVLDVPNRGTPMYKRFKEIPTDIDYLVVIAGHNDACQIAQLGGKHTIKNPTDAEKARQSDMLAAFKVRCPAFMETLKSRFPKAKIVFVTPWNVDRLFFPEVLDTIRASAKATGVACYDAATLSGIKVNNAEFRTKYFQAPNDTAHLNFDGHGLMLEQIEPFLLGL